MNFDGPLTNARAEEAPENETARRLRQETNGPTSWVRTIVGIQAGAVKGAQGAIVSFDTVEARTEHNVAVAALVMAAGVPVVPLKEQAPLALAFPRLDSTIGPAERAGIVAAWQAEKGHTRAPFHVGSTIDGDRLNAWHSGRRDWTLSFGCSPGIVEAVVIDCDDEGGASLLAYLEAHGEVIDFARTPITVSGGRQGWHVWFANPGGKWGCPKIKPDITADVKGRGGQVLLPGMALSPKLYGDTMSGPRHYRSLAGTPDLLEVLRAGTLPPLPACLAALMERNGGAEANPTDERSTHVRAALVALRGDPSPACMARDAMALVEALRGKDAAFDELWREGDDDGSNGRFRLAQALLREYGSNGFEVHDLNEAFDEWDHAVKGNLITDREVARCYGKAVENFGTRNDGGAFGAVVDEDDAPEVGKLDGPQALAEMLRAIPFDDDTSVPEAALRRALNEDSLKRAQAVTLDRLLGSIRAGTALPRSFDELRAAVLAKSVPVYESRASLRARPRSSVRWLVDNLIAAESLFVIHGREKTGKSLVATDIAYSVAYGREWGGRKVHRTGVLVVCPEGPHGFALRQDAWHNRQAEIGPVEDDGPIETRRVAHDLFGSDEHLNAIMEQVRTFKARHGIDCGLVLFDTFRAVTPAADENSPRDVGVFTAKLARLRDACRCAAGYVHHEGKDAAKGAAGSTAHTANVDSVMQVRRTKGGCVLTPTMQRDTGDTRATHFDIVEHDAGEDDEGTMQRAPVAVVRKAPAEPQAKASDGSAMGAVEDPDDEAPAEETAGVFEDGPAERAEMMGQAARKIATTRPPFPARDLYAATNGMRQAAGLKALGATTLDIVREALISSGALRVEGFGRSRSYSLNFN